MTFWFRIAFTWWLGYFISRYLKALFMLIKYMSVTCVIQNRKHYACATRSSLPADRFFTPKLLFGLCLHYTVARFRTAAKFSSQYNNRGEPTRGDSRRHDVLWWYHVNKCRAMRGNRSELALVRKSPRCHVNTSCRYCKWPRRLLTEPICINTSWA